MATPFAVIRGAMLTENKIRRRIMNCARCDLSSKPGILPVPFRGPVTAQIAIVGEAPGWQENQARKPFIGPSGEELAGAMAEAGLSLDACFIMNTINCYPAGKPPPESIEACTIHFKRQLELVRPRFVVTLGNYALKVFKPQAQITKVRGNLYRRKGFILMPTFHPAYILRNRSQRNLWIADFARLAELAGLAQ